MRTIAKLFGRSPFVPLQVHMEKVAACVAKVVELFDALALGDHVAVERLASEISALEHAADEVKNDIRNQLPRGLFMAVDRAALLEILGIQDSLADTSEDIGALLTLKQMAMPEVFRADFRAFLDKNIESFRGVHRIINELDELLETSFGGPEAEKVKGMVERVAFLEHEADVLQRRLVKSLFAHESEMTFGAFHLWNQIFQEVALLSNLSEKLAYRIRALLERK